MASLTWTYTTRSGLSDSTRFFFVLVVVVGAALVVVGVALGGAVVVAAGLVVVGVALGGAVVVGAGLVVVGAAVEVAVPVAAVVLPAVVVAVHFEHPAEDMAAASGVVMELIFEEFIPIAAKLAGGL